MILSFAYSDGTRVERSNAPLVGTSYFATLGLRPQLGQLSFGSGGELDAGPSVILSDEFWRRLGGDPSIVGRSILLDRSPVTVVGVCARRIHRHVVHLQAGSLAAVGPSRDHRSSAASHPASS